jgi:hypothetical protein
MVTPMAKRLMHPMLPNNCMQGTPIIVASILLASCRAPDAWRYAAPTDLA